MIDTGFISANKDRIYTELVCGCCKKHLGSHLLENGEEYDDIEGWKFCPYCGSELYKE